MYSIIGNGLKTMLLFKKGKHIIVDKWKEFMLIFSVNLVFQVLLVLLKHKSILKTPDNAADNVAKASLMDLRCII